MMIERLFISQRFGSHVSKVILVHIFTFWHFSDILILIFSQTIRCENKKSKMSFWGSISLLIHEIRIFVIWTNVLSPSRSQISWICRPIRKSLWILRLRKIQNSKVPFLGPISLLIHEIRIFVIWTKVIERSQGFKNDMLMSF